MIPDSQEYYLAEAVETLLNRLRAFERHGFTPNGDDTVTITVPTFRMEELWAAYKAPKPSTTAHDIRNNIDPLQF